VPRMEWDENGRSWKVLERLPAAAFEVFPIREDGTQRNWSWSHTKVNSSASELKAEPLGLGFAIFRKRRMRREGILPHTIWFDKKYSASEHGTNMLRQILGVGERFSYPKSLYTVMECIRCATERPDAVIVDFFGGSGTTLHAVAALNAEDDGSRRCILITNNEVGEKAARRLAASGIQEGMSEWEQEGICESVTWPRTKACLTGERPDGTRIPGEYLDGRVMADGFDENAVYFKLAFLDPADVTRGEKFESIVPILWMLAGCRGSCELSKGGGKWFIPKANPFAVLLKEDAFIEFQAKLAERPDIDHVFLVTDSTEAFHEIAADLGRGYKSIQLYRSYIDTFRINLTEPGTITPGGVPANPLSVAPLAPLAQEAGGAV
jgi:adenine-specific DNA-methyltransferase